MYDTKSPESNVSPGRLPTENDNDGKENNDA